MEEIYSKIFNFILLIKTNYLQKLNIYKPDRILK